jgi:hypothetical protein
MIDIKYYKWDIKEIKQLKKSISNMIHINNLQTYMPIMALYFYFHNTPNSHKIIDFNRRYYIHQITNINKYTEHYNSNQILDGIIYDKINKTCSSMKVFMKISPILDPITYIMNNYNSRPSRNQFLPSNYTYNTTSKINSMENGSYIDGFMSYIGDNISSNKLLPCFAKYYGSLNGIIDNFSYDITDEFHSFKNENWFINNIGKIFHIDVYESSDEEQDEVDSEEGDCEEVESCRDTSDLNNDGVVNSPIKGGMDKYISIDDSPRSSRSSRSSQKSNMSNMSNRDYIVNIKNFPVQMTFMEKLEGTLEDLLEEDVYSEPIIKSMLFQIIFSLAYLQKHFKFTHNDLHINNIMYTTTEQKFLYYKQNNTYYKVPTYGKLAKIIDFGRAIFTLKNKVFFNDVFSKYGEAEGQYTYPINYINYNIEKKKHNDKHYPNYSFDLCRLATTMIEYVYDNDINKKLYDMLNKIATDCNGENLNEYEDSFDLYVKIAHDSNKGIPKDLICNKYFKEYRIKKKCIFKKTTIYSL